MAEGYVRVQRRAGTKGLTAEEAVTVVVSAVPLAEVDFYPTFIVLCSKRNLLAFYRSFSAAALQRASHAYRLERRRTRWEPAGFNIRDERRVGVERAWHAGSKPNAQQRQTHARATAPHGAGREEEGGEEEKEEEEAAAATRHLNTLVWAAAASGD